jgi:hypothetical protein
MINHSKSFHHYPFSERGQALILIVFAIIGLFGVSALAIDGGRAYLERRNLQAAADAAALSGALKRIEGGNWRAAALASADSNGYDNDGISNTVELNTPPIDGPYSDNPEYIQVIITSHLDTFFGPIIGVPSLRVSTQAVSQTQPAMYGEMFEGYALVSLAPSSRCEKREGFVISEEATLWLQGGGLFINSNNPTCAYVQFGSGSVRLDENLPFTIVGGATIQKPKLHTPFPPQTGAVPMSYPPPYQMPKVGCGSTNAEVIGIDGSAMTLGNWDGDFPPEGVSRLESGVYCIGGDFIVEGGNSLEGDGVTFVVKHDNIRFSGSATIKLTAPISEGISYSGLLIYMPMGNKKTLTLNGNYASEFKGTILAPSAHIQLNGMDNDDGFASQIAGYTIEVKGMDIIRINYKDEHNFDTFRMPEVRLSQ